MKSGIDSLAQLATPDLTDARLALLVVLLMLAAFIDVRTFRIPNWLTYGGAVIGLALGAAIQWRLLGPAWAIDGFLWSLGGLAAGLALMLPMYVLLVMGAGDVKLMAMAGAFLGFPDALWAGLATFLAGGLLSLGLVLYRGALRTSMTNLAELARGRFDGLRLDAAGASAGTLPYGVAIAVGTIGYLVLRQLGFIN